VKANSKSGIDATVQADESGKFEFIVRFNSEALSQLQISATSHDETQGVLHRFAWEAKELVTKGIELKLQPLRNVEVEVVDSNGSPIENARVAVQLGWPHILHGFETDRTGLATFQLPEQERIEAVVAWKDHVGLDYRVYSLNRNQKADVKAVPPEFPKDRAERLVLEGASPLTIRTVDDADKPLAGVSVYPWLLYKGDDQKELNLSFLTELFTQETDTSGETILQWFPAWHKKLLTIWTNVDGYERPRGNYYPENGNGTLVIKLNRLVPIRGQVLDEDRKPALGVEVVTHGVGRSHNQFDTSIKTDADGRYELLVAPNQIYIVCVQDPKWAARAQTGFAVLPNQPIDGRDFQLRKPTRVHGQLINEVTKEAIPNEQVIVYHYGTALHELPDVTLPNPENERWVLSPIVQHYAQTNKLGEFEFFLGDGKFDIRPPQQERSEKFEISGESELELTVTTKVQPEVELVGLVVRKDNLQPVVGAKVYGVPRSFRGNDWEAESGEDGKFKVKHNAQPTYAYATNADKSLVGVAEIPDTRLAIVMQLEPAGSARGRLINDAKEPVVGQRIDYGIDVPDEENRTWSTRFGGYVITDANGEFELKSLANGREYNLSLPHRPDGTIPGLTKVIAKAGEMIDLGDLALPAPAVPRPVMPTPQDRIQAAFNVIGTPVERYTRALELIKLVNQHLLVVFGKPDDPRILSLFKIREDDNDFQSISEEFRFMAIPTDGDRSELAVALSEKLDEKLPETKQPFQLVILDATGKKVASAGIEELCNAEELSRDKLLELLRKSVPEPLDARKLYDEALKQAAKEKKCVIIQETATWCGPCHMLSRLLDANRVWEKDYIWLKIDHRYTGYKELMKPIRDGAQGGIPWFAILDASGQKLATSNDLKTRENIGFPGEKSGQIHFANMLNTTRQRMTEQEVESMIKSATDIGK